MQHLSISPLDTALIVTLLVAILIMLGFVLIRLMRPTEDGEDAETIDILLAWVVRLVGRVATPETIAPIASWVYDYFGGSMMMTRDEFVAYAVNIILSIIDNEVSVQEALPDALLVESI
jgi:hypothetical protein